MSDQPTFAYLVVTLGGYDGDTVEGVFSTEETASAHAELIKPKRNRLGWGVEVEPWADGETR